MTPEIAKQLGMSNVDVLQSFELNGWSIINVDTHQSDQAFLFYAHDPLTSRYVTLWSGGAARDEEESIRSWVVQNAHGIPARLARCFAWHVTKDRGGLSGHAQSQDVKLDGEVVMGVGDLVLSPGEVVALSDEAWSGSGEAALKLFLYYGSVRLDFDKADYWTIIAAENGNAVGQYNAWVQLSDERSSAEDQKRAIFWLRKAAAQNVPEAILELRKMKLEK